jgi:hypothetical protein
MGIVKLINFLLFNFILFNIFLIETYKQQNTYIYVYIYIFKLQEYLKYINMLHPFLFIHIQSFPKSSRDIYLFKEC